MQGSLSIRSRPGVTGISARRDPVPVRETSAADLDGTHTISERGEHESDRRRREPDQHSPHHDIVVDTIALELLHSETAASVIVPDSARACGAYNSHGQVVPAPAPLPDAEHADLKA